MNRKEIWMPILQDYCYEVKDDGQVRNSRTGRILKPKKDKGYERVSLYKNGKKKMFRVHRLVWEAFYGEIPKGMVIDHWDGVKTNNCLENLRCVTQKENVNNPNTLTDEWRRNKAEVLRKLAQSTEWRKKTAETTRKANNKSIVQVDKVTGETIKRWECAMDVERELGINNASISLCCQGKRKSAGGFCWRFFIPPAVIFDLNSLDNLTCVV